MKTALRLLAALVAITLLAAATYAGNVVAGMHEAPQTSGTIAGMGVRESVQILRDGRGVPHIRAQNLHDLFFAQGFVEGSDRLFQLDLTRRYVLGELAEILGSPLLSTDEAARTIPVRTMVARQWDALDTSDRRMLQAFADGVNAAMKHEPTPPEFRLLAYRPKPWRPQDALVVGMATVIDLTDMWNDIANRSLAYNGATPHSAAAAYDAIYPLSDPCYQAPVTQGLAALKPASSACTLSRNLAAAFASSRAPIGSNEWAAGAAHSLTGRALLANDPHLRLGIPGVWYLVDLQAPGYHAAGATLAGVPGVILGHNDALAWGATNGTVESLSVFDAPPNLPASNWHTERIRVRFGATVVRRYYRSRTLFGARVLGKRLVLVRWKAYVTPRSPLGAFEGLARAGSIGGALAALRTYTGPPQNFALADTTGRVAYVLAGQIPDDPGWGRYIHPAADLAKHYPDVPRGALPHVAPSRSAIVWTANNQMYGPGYPYRLSAQFAPPYRAYRIATLLRARPEYDVNYFASMQMDTLSLPESELARTLLHEDAGGTLRDDDALTKHALNELALWRGHFNPESRGASVVAGYRATLLSRLAGGMLDLVRRQHVDGFSAYVAAHPKLVREPWSTAGATVVKHPLAALGITFLNGSTLPGDGDPYTIHVQNQGFSQSFRAVWDVGNWDAGGISIPQGESGWPGSGHYTDEASAWIAGRLLPLPYSDAAVNAAARERLTLAP